jgi:hypothetical protein
MKIMMKVTNEVGHEFVDMGNILDKENEIRSFCIANYTKYDVKGLISATLKKFKFHNNQFDKMYYLIAHIIFFHFMNREYIPFAEMIKEDV